MKNRCYHFNENVLNAIKAAGGPAAWARHYGFAPKTVADYCCGRRGIYEITLRALFAEKRCYWLSLGLKSWADLAA